MSRQTVLAIQLSVVGAEYLGIGWLGTRYGAWAFFIAMFAMIVPTMWLFFDVLPKAPELTAEEAKAAGDAWQGFFHILFDRLVPLAIGCVIWYRCAEWLGIL